MESTIDAGPDELTHSLLKRQVKRHLGDLATLPPAWHAMLVAVNEAYLQNESDYSMLERSLELSSQELHAANADIRAVYERLILSNVDGIFAFDRNCCFTVWNPSMEQFTGTTRLHVLGKTAHAFDAIPLFQEMEYGCYFQQVLAGEAVQVAEYVSFQSAHVPATAQQFFECRFAPLLNEAGTIVGGLGVLRDITARKLAEDALHRQHASLSALQDMALRLTSEPELYGLLEDVLERIRLLLDTPHTFLALLEPENNVLLIQFASGAFKRTIGQWIGLQESTIAELFQTRAPVIRENFQGIPGFKLDSLHDWVIMPLLKRSDVIGAIGVAYANEGRCPGEGEIALLKQFAQLASIGLVHGELNDANERLITLATTDTLTDLPNRSLLLQRIAEFLSLIEQEVGSMALLMLDLDRFKEVNDTFGHQLGDQLLQHVGQRLCQAVPAGATVARLGGDEFAVFLPFTGEAEVHQVVSKISTVLEQSFLVVDTPLHIEASIGVALYPAHGTDALTLFRHADVAMYNAKRKHEGWALYDANFDQYSPLRLALLGDLRKAITNNELRLYYQPKAELKTGRVKGVEALIRWQHSTYGFIPPDQFIPLAEQTGLINPLTRWVVETAVMQCRRWLDAGYELAVAVNLSMWNLRDVTLPATIHSLLTQYGVPPHFLFCEITESAIMNDVEHVLRVLHDLFALGVRIAIDDYGTGYASLAYLKRLPADELKIDRAFVQHLVTDLADQAIVRSTVNMAHSMGIRVVAEGVDNQETWDLLAAFHCDSVQGYFLSRPVPASSLESWLGERKELLLR